MDCKCQNELKKINSDIKDLSLKIQLLTYAIDELKTTCGRMDTHVSNVENVYESVRMPLSFIKNKINRIISSDVNITEDLPTIKHKV